MKYPRFKLIISDKNKKVIHRYYSRRKKSVLARLNLYYKRGFSVYVKIVYGKDVNSVDFDNEGTYFTKKDAIYAYKCFTEDSLIKDF